MQKPMLRKQSLKERLFCAYVASCAHACIYLGRPGLSSLGRNLGNSVWLLKEYKLITVKMANIYTLNAVVELLSWKIFSVQLIMKSTLTSLPCDCFIKPWWGTGHPWDLLWAGQVKLVIANSVSQTCHKKLQKLFMYWLLEKWIFKVCIFIYYWHLMFVDITTWELTSEWRQTLGTSRCWQIAWWPLVADPK